MILAYVGLYVTLGLFIGFFGAMAAAAVMDWNYRRKNRLWIELQRTNYRKRPAAK
jgi:hypothetical protein